MSFGQKSQGSLYFILTMLLAGLFPLHNLCLLSLKSRNIYYASMAAADSMVSEGMDGV